ncbi:hypothetical protein B0J12DRAFT_695010 [Macrophomina phaseolina]|uniref:Uncharacterized protein n=1 Tax=Macrophomina phaseolina TaxID=35725 RepID=A0ABQ8GQJ8_9PEZI|nr:hypothetical protein B0J12DRAFT_695010 [Macrophomina phaseolina]
MKCHKDTNELEVVVFHGKDAYDEYSPHFDEDGNLCCWLPVEAGSDELTIVAHIGGNFKIGHIDVLIDGFLRCSRAVKSNGARRGSRTEKFLTAYCLNEQSNITSYKMVMKELGARTLLKTTAGRVGTIELRLALANNDYAGTHDLAAAASAFRGATDAWMSGGPSVHSDIAPTHTIGFVEQKVLPANQQSTLQKNHFRDGKSRPGLQPWATCKFYYRSLHSITENGLQAVHGKFSYPLQPDEGDREYGSVSGSQDTMGNKLTVQTSDGHTLTAKPRSQEREASVASTFGQNGKPVTRSSGWTPVHPRALARGEEGNVTTSPNPISSSCSTDSNTSSTPLLNIDLRDLAMHSPTAAGAVPSPTKAANEFEEERSVDGTGDRRDNHQSPQPDDDHGDRHNAHAEDWRTGSHKNRLKESNRDDEDGARQSNEKRNGKIDGTVIRQNNENPEDYKDNHTNNVQLPHARPPTTVTACLIETSDKPNASNIAANTSHLEITNKPTTTAAAANKINGTAGPRHYTSQLAQSLPGSTARPIHVRDSLLSPKIPDHMEAASRSFPPSAVPTSPISTNKQRLLAPQTCPSVLIPRKRHFADSPTPSHIGTTSPSPLPSPSPSAKRARQLERSDVSAQMRQLLVREAATRDTSREMLSKLRKIHADIRAELEEQQAALERREGQENAGEDDASSPSLATLVAQHAGAALRLESARERLQTARERVAHHADWVRNAAKGRAAVREAAEDLVGRDGEGAALKRGRAFLAAVERVFADTLAAEKGVVEVAEGIVEALVRLCEGAEAEVARLGAEMKIVEAAMEVAEDIEFFERY